MSFMPGQEEIEVSFMPGQEEIEVSSLIMIL